MCRDSPNTYIDYYHTFAGWLNSKDSWCEIEEVCHKAMIPIWTFSLDVVKEGNMANVDVLIEVGHKLGFLMNTSAKIIERWVNLWEDMSNCAVYGILTHTSGGQGKHWGREFMFILSWTLLDTGAETCTKMFSMGSTSTREIHVTEGRDESRVMEGLIRYDLAILLESNQGWELTQCWYSTHLGREDVWHVFTESFHLLLTFWPFGKLIETLNLSHRFFLDRATSPLLLSSSSSSSWTPLSSWRPLWEWFPS